MPYTAGEGGGGYNITINNTRTFMKGGTSGRLEAKLEDKTTALVTGGRRLLDKKDDDERRSRYDYTIQRFRGYVGQIAHEQMGAF